MTRNDNTDDAAADLTEESRRIWDANAEWWDDRIGDGNAFQIELIEPATERLLNVRPGDVILDIACGAGRFARRMVELGASVVAFDFSEKFIARAKQRTIEHAERIEYHVIDATDGEQMLRLGRDRFDAAVATMALMDIESLDPLMSALARMLKKSGRFVFSVTHPCFFSAQIQRFAEDTERDGRLEFLAGVRVTGYLTASTTKTEGILGQPQLQYSFHRPLEVLFGAAFRQGFAIDGLLEPALEDRPCDPQRLNWRNMRDIPPVLVVRTRLAATRDE
jgi:2-polyprenyl-3-methyl-5-hydroxy-6-metoxy-1,4-benzoquinol methylase